MSIEGKCPTEWYAALPDGMLQPDHGINLTGPPHRCIGLLGHPGDICRCVCSAERPRPVARASITVDESGIGRVMAGLSDLTELVSAGTVKFRAGHPTVIEIEIPMAAMAARGDITLDEDTAKALETLGWSGPDTELLRRRDLQEALGGLGTVLREWDGLLTWVRALVNHNAELVARLEGEGDPVLTKVAEALGPYAPHEVKWSRVLEEVRSVVELAQERRTSDE